MTIFEEMRQKLKESLLIGPLNEVEQRMDKLLDEYFAKLEGLFLPQSLDFKPDFEKDE